MIVSELDLKREGRSYGIGDRIALRLGDRVIEKRIVGIAQYRNEHYGYTTASGYWIQKEELLEHVDGSSAWQTALLFRVADPEQLPKVAKDLERCLTLLNIYPLVNPQEISVVGSSFIQTIFLLFESFSSLAALIGCIGLMIVMYRIVIERRRQFGMLRAIGVLPGMISGSMILEGAIIGIVGMMLGLVIGSYTGYLMIETLSAAGEVPPQEFPYGKFGLYAAAGLALTLLCTALPARNIMRLHPAEATRYVEG
jgi:ABC-type lipoprotein release transport system permease subunit